MWKNLSHPNVLPFIGAAMMTEPGQEKCEIISELMENGDITTFLRQTKVKPTRTGGFRLMPH